MDHAIRIEAVSKEYGSGAQRTYALRDVSLAVPRGTFLSVMGSSGSGKSTLLNLVAGLDRPTTGRVLVAGHDLATMADGAASDLRLRRIGYVFQAFHLFPQLSVLQNVAWRLEFLGERVRDARAEAAAMLDEVRIPAALHDRGIAELSGGEQQRVAIARALATRPDILLADEPTGNLDSQTGIRILDLLRRLNLERGVSVVMVTHSGLAATYGERTIELSDGRVVQDVSVDRPQPALRLLRPVE